MKNLYKLLLGLCFGVLTLFSCVDDYKDANPPRLLDAPAINSFTISNESIKAGTTTTVVLNVVDAPAGLASAKLIDVDKFGISADGSYTVSDFAGITSGNVTFVYTAPDNFDGVISLEVSVTDSQIDNKGEDASKTTSISTSVDVFCGKTGTYDVSGVIGFDDFGSGPYNYTEYLRYTNCTSIFQTEDITGGLYSGDYATNYGTSGRKAIITINSDNSVTWTGLTGAAVSDQFGGMIIQDDTMPTSNYNPTTGEVTIYWVATRYGEFGTTVYSE